MTESKVEIYGRWAEQLYQNGYDPLPLKGKKGMSGWTTFSMPDDEFERAEYLKKHKTKNIGLRTGELVVIDIDEEEPEKIEIINQVMLQCLGPSDFVRIGRPPRKAYFYRTKTSIRKLQTGGVEILGVGQQVVVAGIHPETKKPYSWPNESILDATLEDLPITTEDRLLNFNSALRDVYQFKEADEPVTYLAAEGARNNSLFNSLRERALEVSSHNELEQIAFKMNETNIPPLRASEVISVVNSVWKNRISNQIIPPGEQFAKFARKEYGLCTPDAFYLLATLKYTRDIEVYTITQGGTAKYFGWGQKRLQNALKVLLDNKIIFKVGEKCVPNRPRNAYLYSFHPPKHL